MHRTQRYGKGKRKGQGKGQEKGKGKGRKGKWKKGREEEKEKGGKKKVERKRRKDYWAAICSYKATNIFTSSVHKGTLVINICDRCAGRQVFWKKKKHRYE